MRKALELRETQNFMIKTILTDCFNTIILRKTSAEEVVFNWCIKLGGKYSVDANVLYKLFYKNMIKIAIKNLFKTGEIETEYAEVMARSCSALKQHITDLDVEEFKKDALNIYIETEAESQFVNREFVDKLEQFKSGGAKIYVVSEFYLGKDVLKQWLDKLGILHIFDDVFSSSDYMLTKRSGRLYKKLTKELGLKKKETIMFGDNILSDIIAARLFGIKTKRTHARAVKPTKTFKQQIKYGRYHKEITDVFNERSGNYNFSNHAFPFFLFTRRLLAQLEQREVKNVFFLSREGQFLKKLFDNYCALTHRGQDIKSHYLYASRNSLYRARLRPLAEEDFEFILKAAWGMSIYAFLSTLDFTAAEIETVNSQMNTDVKKKHRKFGNSDIYKKLIASKAFKDIYEQKRKGQAEALSAYLDSFGVDFKKEGMHIVDIGWRGTMQNLLKNCLDSSIAVNGYYVCLKTFFGSFIKSNKACFQAGKSKQGLLHHVGNKEQFGNKLFEPLILHDYEQVCRADHNRTEAYEIKDGKPVVIFANNTVDEGELHKKYFAPIQKQIEEKFNKLCAYDTKHLSLMEPMAIEMFYNMIKKASRHDLNFIADALESYHDNFVMVGYLVKGINRSYIKLGYRLLYWRYTVQFAFAKRRVRSAYLRLILNSCGKCEAAQKAKVKKQEKRKPRCHHA